MRFVYQDALDPHHQYRSVYANFLYSLLKERLKEPHTNISHTKLPSYGEHLKFLADCEYEFYDVLVNEFDYADCIGAVYLTKNNEIGIHIAKKYRGQGYGTSALEKILVSYPNEKFYANINPNNKTSIALFSRFGFTHLQNTYSREPYVYEAGENTE